MDDYSIEYLAPPTVLLSLWRTDKLVIRPLMTVSAIMLFSLIWVAATTRHSNSSGIVSAVVGTSEIFRLQLTNLDQESRSRLYKKRLVTCRGSDEGVTVAEKSPDDDSVMDNNKEIRQTKVKSIVKWYSTNLAARLRKPKRHFLIILDNVWINDISTFDIDTIVERIVQIQIK